MNKFPYMHPREIILVLALFVLLALVLGNGMEIISCPSPDDDAFYVRKSLSLLGSWSDSATLKEIGSPLFFRLVRTACIPLRIAFGVGYALALFLAWLELRRWRFPAWLSLVATLVPLFMPAQYSVFSRATADPLSVILSLCLFVACLAVYRRNGCWLSTTGAGIVAAMIWLNRPEGTLGILPVIFTLALLRFKKEGDVPPPGFRKITTRIAAVIAILLATMLCIDTVNRVHYGFFAPTIMKAAPLDRTLKRLSSIDDGEPPVPGRPVSKRAMELAFKNSPSMALARQYWSDNTDGKGWSSSNFRDYSPADGSVDGGHFHFAFRYSAAAVAGSNTRAQLRYFQQTAGELESAMRRGALPRRSVPGNALGPSFNIASPGLWKSVWETSRLMLGGGGDILKPSDTADTEQNLMFDFACSRRGGLLPAGTDYVQIRGWMALGDKSGIIDQIFPETMPGESTFHIVNRPDVPQALYGRRIDPANCGFELTVPAGDAAKMILLVSANGHKERFPALELMGMKDTEIIRGMSALMWMKSVRLPLRYFRRLKMRQ